MSNANATAASSDKRTAYAQETKVELGPFKFVRRRWLNLDLLSSIARANADVLRPLQLRTRDGLDIHASDEQLGLEFREVTGEDILRATSLVGGTAEIVYGEDGVIDSITASIDTYFEYDSGEMSQVLESLQATGVTPKKFSGDLAQTSVSVAGSQVQVIGLGEWSLSWKRKTVDATTTDDAEYESALGSTKSWSVKAKYMFIDGDTSQSNYVFGAINTLQNDAQLWNFFPTVEIGRAAFQGYAIVDGLDIQTGMGKMVGWDVSLKGTGALFLVQQTNPVANPNTVTGQSAQVPAS